MNGDAAVSVNEFWHILGGIGAVIFYGRFYVQWIASERAGRSVMPLLFWYMSSVGSVMLMAYAVATRSPLGALSQNFNIAVYGRNLIHIWREKGTLTPLRKRLVYAVVGVVALAAVYLLVVVWAWEIEEVQKQPDDVSRQMWLWLGVGVAGQALFAARFLVQWLATERARRSVVPPSFWYLSLGASVLQAAAFLQRGEWIFGVGMLATVLIYLRNIWFVRKEGAAQGAAA